MSRLVLYHGSLDIIREPVYGKGKLYNDYGRGFYCTEHEELAKEWACTEVAAGFVSKYLIETDNLSILNLSSEEYTILHWLALLVKYRRLRAAAPVMRRGAQWLEDHFLIDISGYDAIVGYRADDSYFSFARAFLNNEISISQLSYAMRFGKLGEQFVLKSPKAFEEIHFQSFRAVNHDQYYTLRKDRDNEARAAYQAELEKEDVDGLYMREIIREEVRPDDPRIR